MFQQLPVKCLSKKSVEKEKDIETRVGLEVVLDINDDLLCCDFQWPEATCRHY